MLWFRHFSDASSDDKLLRVIDEFGFEGYGVYWAIIERIAVQMEPKSSRHDVTLSVKNWRKVTSFSPKKLEKYLNFLQDLSLIFLEKRENLITISCPKLLFLRDEYSRKRARLSGHCTDNSTPAFVSVSVSDSVSVYNQPNEELYTEVYTGDTTNPFFGGA